MPSTCSQIKPGSSRSFHFLSGKETTNKEIYKKQMKLQTVITARIKIRELITGTKLEGKSPGGCAMKATQEEELEEEGFRGRDQEGPGAWKEQEPGMW